MNFRRIHSTANNAFMRRRRPCSQTLGQLASRGRYAPAVQLRTFTSWRNATATGVTRSGSRSHQFGTKRRSGDGSWYRVGWVCGGVLGLLGAGVGLASAQSNAEVERVEGEVVTKQFKYYTGKKLDPDDDSVRVFGGSANPELASLIAHYLGVPLGVAEIGRFADGEISIKVCENVRGKHVFIVQPICPPMNDNLMEALLLVSTMRRSSAKSISLVMPYYGYARSDRKTKGRMPIAAKDVASMLETVGVDHILTVDIHSGQIQGFFSSQVQSDNLSGIHVGAGYFSEMPGLKNPVVVSITPNGVHRAKTFWQVLINREEDFEQSRFVMAINADEGERWENDEVKDPVYEIVGEEHIAGNDAIIVTDIIDTAIPICTVGNQLKAAGAKRVFVFSSHGLFSGDAAKRINDSAIEQVVVTNTVTTPVTPRLDGETKKITWLSLAPLLVAEISQKLPSPEPIALTDVRRAQRDALKRYKKQSNSNNASMCADFKQFVISNLVQQR